MNANPEIKSTLSQTLIKLRNLKAVTQEEVSDALGISNKTLSKWENGTSSPDADMIVSLADYYGVSIDGLYGRESAPLNGDIKVYISDYLKSLPSDERINKAFELTNTFIRGTFENSYDSENPKYPLDFLHYSDCPNCFSAVSSDAGTEFLVNSDTMNMFVILAPNKDNFKTVIANAANYRPLFEFLGKPYAIEVFTVIFRKNFPDKFTPEFVGKKFNIPADTVKNLLDEAVRLDILRKITASLKDGDVEVYEIPANCHHSERTILPMICLAYEQICAKEYCYINACHGRFRMIEEV